jgi:hypothetical protein
LHSAKNIFASAFMDSIGWKSMRIWSNKLINNAGWLHLYFSNCLFAFVLLIQSEYAWWCVAICLLVIVLQVDSLNTTQISLMYGNLLRKCHIRMESIWMTQTIKAFLWQTLERFIWYSQLFSFSLFMTFRSISSMGDLQ